MSVAAILAHRFDIRRARLNLASRRGRTVASSHKLAKTETTIAFGRLSGR
jgi:hypothetical protein